VILETLILMLVRNPYLEWQLLYRLLKNKVFITFEDWEVLEDTKSMLETLILMLVKDPYLEWQSIVETFEQESMLSCYKMGKHLNIQRSFLCGFHVLQMVNHGSVMSSRNQLAVLRISPCGTV
jgi:hypothetical protein